MDIASGSSAKNSAIQSSTVQWTGLSPRRAQEGNATSTGSDQVVISQQGLLLQQMGEALGEDSNQRETKVNSIRSSVENGTYGMSSVEIARAMLASRSI